MPEYRVTLKQLVRKARRYNCSLNEIYIVLALAELGAWYTPYFEGLRGEELADVMVKFVRNNLRKFFTHYTEPNWQEEDMYEYLSSLKEFKYNIEELKNIFQCIKKKGEQNYGFKNIDRLG